MQDNNAVMNYAIIASFNNQEGVKKYWTIYMQDNSASAPNSWFEPPTTFGQ